MKKFLFFILALLAFTGCKKDIEYYSVESRFVTMTIGRALRSSADFL